MHTRRQTCESTSAWSSAQSRRCSILNSIVNTKFICLIEEQENLPVFQYGISAGIDVPFHCVCSYCPTVTTAGYQTGMRMWKFVRRVGEKTCAQKIHRKAYGSPFRYAHRGACLCTAATIDKLKATAYRLLQHVHRIPFAAPHACYSLKSKAAQRIMITSMRVWITLTNDAEHNITNHMVHIWQDRMHVLTTGT